MGNFVPNIALGRNVELYNRVDTNDPANSAIIIVALAATGIEGDAVLRDKETLFDMLSGTTNEATNSGYARKVLTDADIVAFAPDHVNNKTVLYVPDQTFAAVQAAGGMWSDLVFCYDPDTTSGTDASLIPMSVNDFEKTPDGSDIIMTAPNGFFEVNPV